jgi:hypothetical protein
MRLAKGVLRLSAREQRTLERADEILCEAISRLQRAVGGDPTEAALAVVDTFEELDAARFGLNCLDFSATYSSEEVRANYYEG